MTTFTSRRYFWYGILFAMAVLLLDQVSKELLVTRLGANGEQSIEILPFFKLVMVWNQGISFGMFSHSGDMRKWLLIGLALSITLFMLTWLWKVHGWLLTSALGLVIGGALGNVIDRLRWGAVADFFYFHYEKWFWPAFNIADSAIFIGVVLLCWESMLTPNKTK